MTLELPTVFLEPLACALGFHSFTYGQWSNVNGPYALMGNNKRLPRVQRNTKQTLWSQEVLRQNSG